MRMLEGANGQALNLALWHSRTVADPFFSHFTHNRSTTVTIAKTPPSPTSRSTAVTLCRTRTSYPRTPPLSHIPTHTFSHTWSPNQA